MTNCLNDGLCWTVLKCIHDDEKVLSTQKTALMAECNTKLAVALSIMEESFLPMLDPRTGKNMLSLILYNLRSKISQVNCQGFYTVALGRDDELFSVASIRVHGVTLAELPLITTCVEQRQAGMCRRLMHVIEEMLKSLKVEMLVLSAIPSLVETWTSTFGFQHINDDDKKKLCGINLMIFPGATLLKKNLFECERSELGKDDDLSLSNFSSSNNAPDKIHKKTSTEAPKPSFNSPALDPRFYWSFSTEQTATIQAPVAGADKSTYPFPNSYLSCPPVYTDQYSGLISDSNHLKNNGEGNNYAGYSTNNIDGMHEVTTEVDPYIEALNCFKSSLASF
ncbi:increased DNA methylation 1-like [Phalaenopsis equestris]|uniref:increased DNA methylation 1-like n=1 Tax=Phalaenopsis equestris TaxID=78828 RepID=UPI0009E6052F|nr:increased DNA methylation 1-like [Phalaenopsis equestris]